MRKLQKVVLSLLVFIACCASDAYAGLIGSNVVSQYYTYGETYDDLGSPASFVANGTVQETFEPGGFGFNLTITDDQIIYELFETGPWSPSETSLDSDGLFIANGNLLTFSGLTITGVTLDDSSNVPGFTSSNVTYNGSNIAIDWTNLGDGGQRVVLNVTSSAASVPEPAGWTTLLVGFTALGLWKFRRRDRFRSGSASFRC